MRNDDRVRLQHMIEAAESAIDFVSGRVRPDLDSDQHAVVRPRPGDRDRGRGCEQDQRRGARGTARDSMAGDRRHAQSTDSCLFRS